MAACAMAVAALAGARGAEQTVVSAFTILQRGPEYRQWLDEQEGLFGVVYITESCSSCAHTQNAIESAADAMRISTGMKIPIGILDCEPSFSGMEWAMEELGLEQKFPAIVIFKSEEGKDREVAWKHSGSLPKDSLFNILMKLNGHLIFPRKLKEISKMLRLGIENVIVAFCDPGDPDEAQKLSLLEDFVKQNKMVQVQKIGGTGVNAKEWDMAKKKFGLSQTTFAVMQSAFSAEMNHDAKAHFYYTSFEDVDALTRFYHMHATSDIHWDYGSALGALALDKHVWATRGEDRPGKDGLVVFSSSVCFEKKRTETKKLAKRILPLIPKFPNLVFLITSEHVRTLDPEWNKHDEKWAYTAPDIASIGEKIAVAASRNLKVQLVVAPKDATLPDGTVAGDRAKVHTILDQLPLQKEGKAYPKGWGIPFKQKASYRGDKFDLDDIERRLEQALLRQEDEEEL